MDVAQHVVADQLVWAVPEHLREPLVDALENKRARVEDGHAERPVLEDLPKALLAVAPGAHRGLQFRLGLGQPFHQRADAREGMLDDLPRPARAWRASSG